MLCTATKKSKEVTFEPGKRGRRHVVGVEEGTVVSTKREGSICLPSFRIAGRTLRGADR